MPLRQDGDVLAPPRQGCFIAPTKRRGEPCWHAAAPDLTEAETRDALEQVDPLWEELFPAEQARMVRSLVDRVDVNPAGADIRLRLDGLAGLVRDLRAQPVTEVA